MKATILVLLSVALLPSLAWSQQPLTEDALDPASVSQPVAAGGEGYVHLIARFEKRDSAGAAECGVVVRCMAPSETDCRIQYKTELGQRPVGVVKLTPATSGVRRGDRGTFEVKGQFSESRAAAEGVPAPALHYLWELSGVVKATRDGAFNYVQKQRAASVEVSFNGQRSRIAGFALDETTHCRNMIKVAP
jgi:hypothetical protein